MLGIVQTVSLDKEDEHFMSVIYKPWDSCVLCKIWLYHVSVDLYGRLYLFALHILDGFHVLLWTKEPQ